jgi:hypothetical protein
MEFGEDYCEFEADEGEPRPRRKRRRKPKPHKEFEPAEDIAAAPEQEVATIPPSLTQWPCPPVTDLYLLRADHVRRSVDWLWRLSTYFLQQRRKPWKKLGCVPLRPLVTFRERLVNCISDRQQEGTSDQTQKSVRSSGDRQAAARPSNPPGAGAAHLGRDAGR